MNVPSAHRIFGLVLAACLIMLILASGTGAAATQSPPRALADTEAELAAISGTKYEDRNADGDQDAEEPGLAGWTIYVDYDDDEVLDTGEPSGETDENGAYTVEGIDPGTWKVKEALQTGWTCSEPDPCYHSVTLESSDEIIGKKFGNYRIRQITKTSGVINNHPSISGNGAWVAFVSDVDGNPEIYRTEVSSAVTQPVTASTDRVTNEFPSTNADGAVIAFVSDGDLKADGSNADGNQEIFIAEPGAVPEITAVTSTTGSIFPGFNLSPSIDDAGLHIALASDHDLQAGANADGNLEIFVATRGNGSPTIVQVSDSAMCTNAQPSLSGNGRLVAFVSDGDLDPDGSNADGGPEIFVAKLDVASMGVIAIAQCTDSRMEVTNAHPSISTLGGRIAFISDVDGNPEVFVAELDIESMDVIAITQITDSGAAVTNAHPSISGSGQYIAFVSDGDLDPSGSNDEANPEIFIAELNPESLEVISITQITYSDEGVTNAQPYVSILGGRVAFISDGDLDPKTGNGDGNPEVFVATIRTANEIIVQKTASAGQVRAGEPLTYTITVQNYLGPDIPTLVLTDALTSTTVVEKGDLVPIQGSCGTWSDSTVTCTLGELKVTEVVTLTLVITPTQAGVITNTAQVPSLADPFPDNNEDTVLLWPARLYLPLILKMQ